MYTYYILVSSTYLLNMRLLFPYIAHNSVAFICVKAIYIYGHEFLVVTKKEVTLLESPSLKITVLFIRQINGSVQRVMLVLLLGSVKWVSRVSWISNYCSNHFYDFLPLCYLNTCDHSDANLFCCQWKKPKMWVYLFSQYRIYFYISAKSPLDIQK